MKLPCGNNFDASSQQQQQQQRESKPFRDIKIIFWILIFPMDRCFDDSRKSTTTKINAGRWCF